VRCTHADVDADGNVTTVYVTHDPESRGGTAPDGRKVKSTMHWVSAAHRVPVTVGALTDDPLDDLNRDSRELITDATAEPALADTLQGAVVQFERLGYFAHDPRQPMLFHRTVSLKDEWANIQKRR
jgi:glutaminyl-tRNA synthetase